MINCSSFVAEPSQTFSDGQDLQVKTVQEVCGKHTRRWLGTHWPQCRLILKGCCAHTEVQVMLLLRSATGRIPAGRRMPGDAGSAHPTAQVIDQTQQPVRLLLQETFLDGAFEEVLHASAGTPVLFRGVNSDLTLGSRWGHVQAGGGHR